MYESMSCCKRCKFEAGFLEFNGRRTEYWGLIVTLEDVTEFSAWRILTFNPLHNFTLFVWFSGFFGGKGLAQKCLSGGMMGWDGTSCTLCTLLWSDVRFFNTFGMLLVGLDMVWTNVWVIWMTCFCRWIDSWIWLYCSCKGGETCMQYSTWFEGRGFGTRMHSQSTNLKSVENLSTSALRLGLFSKGVFRLAQLCYFGRTGFWDGTIVTHTTVRVWSGARFLSIAWDIGVGIRLFEPGGGYIEACMVPRMETGCEEQPGLHPQEEQAKD
ncbi:hypothetical protein L1987_21594 [Smallanthus sonchifolius]|uniref:Uncharacterized protein n=1 Tax=Smallanthus sonchifolius TaxID=185202 RepID=A0ACB9IVI7_9ASTR|nr:hypothetical protein L1987_21594 [Smallanthus sonchifolius]